MLQLALLAVCGVSLSWIARREYDRRVCTLGRSEASSTLQAIRVAEESYRAEAGDYLGCSAEGSHTRGGDLEGIALHPREAARLDERKIPWFATSSPASLADCWTVLNVRPDGPVRCGYAVAATTPTGGGEPAFVARAVCDRDGDGDRVEYRITSASPTIIVLDGDD